MSVRVYSSQVSFNRDASGPVTVRRVYNGVKWKSHFSFDDYFNHYVVTFIATRDIGRVITLLQRHVT